MLDAGYIVPLKGKLGVKQLLRLNRVDDTAFEDSKRTYQFNPVAVCKVRSPWLFFALAVCWGQIKRVCATLWFI